MSGVYHRVCLAVGCAECRPRVGRQEGGEARAAARQGDSRPEPRRLAAPPSARRRTGGATADPAHDAAAARAAAAAYMASLGPGTEKTRFSFFKESLLRFLQSEKGKSFAESKIERHDGKM